VRAKTALETTKSRPNPREINASNIRASDSTRSAPFPPSRIRSRALTRAHFSSRVFRGLRGKKKESKRVPCASLKLLPLMFIAVSRMFLKCTLKSVPRALHDFVASLDSRAYLTIVWKKIRVLLVFCGLAFSFYYFLGRPPFCRKKISKVNPKP